MPDTPDSPAPYQVLARKYRPAHFRDLIGQDAMVTTLTNAFAQSRIAHAFVLTGVRGVGKTTTARIIAKGLNCTRADRPTIDPCGVCEPCQAIARGAHVDVIEMDAASNTGVDYIREINEAVRYRPAEVRYKVYIIDEVHMLSTGAFNALLKTLEEPPPHVVFVLATTEIRKVPVTVLSRCQRFDLRRIEPEVMMAHLAQVVASEGGQIEDSALGLITRAAEGSVRDALSLLDQALAIGSGGTTGPEEVRAMLGLADRGRVIDLFEAVMRGDAQAALAELAQQYADGADPAVVLRDLAELTHWISVVKISPEHAEDPTVGPDERARGQDLAGRLPMRVLTRAWQMLLKALEEVAIAPNAMMAAEMAVIRLTHVADLDPPEDIIRAYRRLQRPASGGGGGGGGRGGRAGANGGDGASARAVSASAGAGPAHGASGGGGPAGAARMRAQLVAVPGALADAASAPSPRLSEPGVLPDPRPTPQPNPASDPALARLARFEDVVALLDEAREARLRYEAETYVRLIAYRPGLIEFAPAPGSPPDFPSRLGIALKALTGARWSVALGRGAGQPSLSETRAAERAAAEETLTGHPLVAAVLTTFPGAEIRDIRPQRGDGSALPAPEDMLAPAPERDEIDGDLVDTDDDPFDPFEER